MNKNQIMNALYQEDIMRSAHRDLTDGLVGYARSDYIGKPWTSTESIEDSMRMNATRNIINMLVAYLLDSFAKDLVEKIVDIIIKYEAKYKEE